MFSIRIAHENDAALLAEIGKVTFIESHGRSASEADIAHYVSEKYTDDIFAGDLTNPESVYYIIYWHEEPVGYSKIIWNVAHVNVPGNNMAKLERLYLLEKFHGMKLGSELMQFNIDLAKKSGQSGMWLFTWKGNERAISFYLRYGFTIIGSHDFKISETHYNPNHQMLLMF